MKKALIVILMAIMAVSWVGCDDNVDVLPLHFVNASSYAIVIISLSTEWGGFVLPPGAERKLTNIRDVDYIFSPENLVQEGSASNERFIVFVNAEPATPLTSPVVVNVTPDSQPVVVNVITTNAP